MEVVSQEHKVRKLAYWLYLLKGKKSGSELENWLKAEKTVEVFEDGVAKAVKYLSIFAFNLAVIVLLAYFILPLFGYKIILEQF